MTTLIVFYELTISIIVKQIMKGKKEKEKELGLYIYIYMQNRLRCLFEEFWGKKEIEKVICCRVYGDPLAKNQCIAPTRNRLSVN